MQAQAALAELHRLRICHGDVYAHNVLVDDDGSAVLLDYGERTKRTAGSMICEGVYCANGIVQDPWSYHCAVIGGCSASALCALRAVGHAGSLKCDRLTTLLQAPRSSTSRAPCHSRRKRCTPLACCSPAWPPG